MRFKTVRVMVCISGRTLLPPVEEPGGEGPGPVHGAGGPDPVVSGAAGDGGVGDVVHVVEIEEGGAIEDGEVCAVGGADGGIVVVDFVAIDFDVDGDAAGEA